MTTKLTSFLPCYYFRKSVYLDTAPLEGATFTLNYTVDDGCVVYVNGTEAGRYNMPSGNVTYETFATTYADGNPDSGTMTLDASLFHQGTNVIAVEVHNNSSTSSDIYWDASLTYASNATAGDYVAFDEEYSMPETGSMTLQACYGEMTDEEKQEADLSTTPIVINEVSAGNSIYVNEYFKKDDWVELYNTTSEDIDLEGMYLTDNPSKPHKYQITAQGTQASTIIESHGYKIVWCSQRETDTELHASFKLANSNGELVRICAEDDSWADSLVYCAMNGDQTVGRYPDGGSDIYLMTVPTIKQSNLMNTYAALWEYVYIPEDEPTVDDEEETPEEDTDAVLASRSAGMSIARVGDYLTVKSEDSESVRVSLHTVSGITVVDCALPLEAGHARLSIASLPQGVYIARAYDGQGNQCGTKFAKK